MSFNIFLDQNVLEFICVDLAIEQGVWDMANSTITCKQKKSDN
jgi:hypothetical protein